VLPPAIVALALVRLRDGGLLASRGRAPRPAGGKGDSPGLGYVAAAGGQHRPVVPEHQVDVGPTAPLRHDLP
jgi:hypothetical protein